MEIDGHRERRAEPIRLGMVGGGQDAFIGSVHRIAARLDDAYVLLAGALSSTPERALRSGRELGLAEDRIYADFETMAEREAARADGIEAVAIVTPNHLHADIATAFLSRGIHVICDKPLAASLAEGRRIADAVARSGQVFALTHTYSGYPMVRQARALVADGMLGTIRVARADYAQDWLAEPLETSGHKQAGWRTDPAKSGAGGSIGDIGTHAFHLIRFVTGLEITALAADLASFVEGRRVDDNAHVLLRLGSGARGLLTASQIAVGNENSLRLEVYGTQGGLVWQQEDPNRLLFTPIGEPTRILTRNGPGGVEAAHRLTRVPAGHPEGYLEAFANLYAEAAEAIRARRLGTEADPASTYPTVADGLEGLVFIEACVASHARDGAWVSLRDLAL